jgi:sarcosine oxidase subunit beta
MAEFVGFAELTGAQIDFTQVGYLFLVDSADDLATFRRAVEVQRDSGIPSEVVGLDRVRDLVPPVSTAGLVGATYCPADGYATPEAVVQGYAAAARRLGATIRVGCAVTGIRTAGERVVAVETDSGPIATRAVVCAAGVQSAGIAGWLGIDLPVHGEARAIHYSTGAGGVPDGAPLTVDFSSGFYFRRESGGLLFGGRERRLEDLSVPAVHRLPSVADLPITTSWWGYYDMSPDHNAMIGSGPVAGFHYATGFSGHGFQQSPAVGEHVAELVLGTGTTLDLEPLSADRFARGATRTERFVI